MSNQVRVRFAPSPTGPLHIGGVRTALFNYLFAKKHNGTFVLRIEDTDQNRYVANAEKYIIDALNWCNIPFDEGPNKNEKFGPYRQSERKDLYKQYADFLIENDKAYYAFDTTEELTAHRLDHEAKKKTFIYNWHNREKLNNSLKLSPSEVKNRLDNGDKYVIRFKTPTDEILVMQDIIRGEIKIDTNVLDDKILFKSDGMPTYHLANIVDDHLMEISHVIRGEEWLPSMALHILLYRAFDWKAPEFAHLPLILKPTGKGKLSKRDGDKLGFPVFPLEYLDEKTNDVSRGYKEDGYFNDALINMLAFLGWNPGTEQEIFSLEELIKAFSLEKVNKAGARFDLDKTKWFQQQYLQSKSDEELVKLFNPIIDKNLEGHGFVFADFNTEYRTKVIGLIKERATFVNDFWDLSSFFFITTREFDAKASKKAWKEDTSILMAELIAVITKIEDFSTENIEKLVKEWITSKEIGFGKVMQPLRLSLVGAMKGPHIFDIMSLIGKEEAIGRITFAIKSL
ncbi:MAG TPA: glutamate--tRNA ligase [Flavobacteriaceae bacterium]|nr:glutamate--tRNA ligase [Flavobacteriaceae bacterium]